MSPNISPMALGDIFDRSFRLTGRTFVRNLLIAVSVLLPASILLAYGMNQLFYAFADLLRSGNMRTPDSDTIVQLLSTSSVFFLGYFVFYLGMLFATLAAMIVVCSELNDQPISWGEALTTAFSARLLRAMGFVFLEVLALMGMLMLAFTALAAGITMESTLTAVIGGLAIPVAILAAIYLFIRWAFSLPVIAWEDAGVFEAFSRSAYLVRGEWWRVFGIFLLLTIVVQFGISIVTAPINLFALWGFYSKYFEWLGTVRGGEMDLGVLADMFSSIGMGIGASVLVSSVLATLVTPVYHTVMYFDLRARRGEFLPASPSGEAGEFVSLR